MAQTGEEAFGSYLDCYSVYGVFIMTGMVEYDFADDQRLTACV